MTSEAWAAERREVGAALEITIEQRRRLADDTDQRIHAWTVIGTGPNYSDGLEDDVDYVGRLEISKVLLGDPSIQVLMDDCSAELEWIGGALLDKDGELREDLVDRDVLLGGNAILAITRCDIQDEYSGLGVGQLLALEAISQLGGGCDLAVALVISDGEKPGKVRRLDGVRMRRAWTEVGFDHAADGVMVMYLATTSLDENLTRLRQAFGLVETRP